MSHMLFSAKYRYLHKKTVLRSKSKISFDVKPKQSFKPETLDKNITTKTKVVPRDKSHSQTGTEHARVHLSDVLSIGLDPVLVPTKTYQSVNNRRTIAENSFTFAAYESPCSRNRCHVGGTWPESANFSVDITIK